MAHQDDLARQLDAIETELRRLGLWSLELRTSGQPSSYLSAPSFEHWLQYTFLPNAREGLRTNSLPDRSDVTTMAIRNLQSLPDTDHLIQLLSQFDRLVVAASAQRERDVDRQELARDLRDFGVEIVARCDRMVRQIKRRLPPDEFSQWRRRLGRVAGTASTEILNELIAAHPDLKPDETTWRAIVVERLGDADDEPSGEQSA